MVDAAGELVDEVGYERLTLAMLASRLNIKAPSLYKHVANLAELRRLVTLAAISELGAALRAAALGKSGREALAAVAHAYRHYAADHPGRYAAIARWDSSAGDERLGAAGMAAVEVLLAVLHAYHPRESEVMHAVRAVRGASRGFVTLDAVGGFGMAE